MEIETSKILGGIGALLMFIGIIPYINSFGIIGLIGLILVMVALYNLGSYYKEGGIFGNALYGLIVMIVGAVISIVTVFVVIVTSLKNFLYALYPSWNGDWTKLSGLTPNTANLTWSTIAPVIAGIVAVFVILWICAIIAAFFVRRSLGTLSAKSGVGLFSTAGLLLFIGAILIIAIGIGLILIWISALLIAIAFFQIKPQQPSPPPMPPPATT
jgi:uncharacterized membrane protein